MRNTSIPRLLLAALFTLNPLTIRAQQPEGSVVEKRDSIQASQVTATVDRRENSTQTGLKRLDAKDFNSGFALFGSPDIIKTLQMLPGVAGGTELLSGLYVHGGDGSDNLYLLDGVPIYQVSHLAGIFSSFNTDVVESLDFYKSGFPARYGGRLSSVVDVSTREGDMQKYHGSVSIGIIDGRIQLEGPIVKGRTSFNFGIRRTWLDLLLDPMIRYYNKKELDEDEEAWGHYQMNDTNFKLTHLLSDDSKLNLNLYYGDDALKLRAIENGDSMEIGLRWGNFVSSLQWDKIFSHELSSKMSAFYTVSRAVIGADVRFTEKDENGRVTEDSISSVMIDTNHSRVDDFGFNADFDYQPSLDHHIRMGATIQSHIYTPYRDFDYKEIYRGEEFPLYGGHQDNRFTGGELSIYGEDEMRLTSRLRANLGLRYSAYLAPGKIWHSLEPRAALKYQITDRISSKLSYAEMSQFSHLVASTYLDLPTNCWMPSTAEIAPMKSHQLAGGIYTNPVPEININIEWYYKTMDHLLEYSGTNMLFPPLTQWGESVSEGRGKAYGLEFEFAQDLGHTSFEAYYTLSWSKRNFPEFYDGWYLDRNDNRHKITMTGTHSFSERFEVYAAWSYHTGNRVTFPSNIVDLEDRYLKIYDSPNNVALPNYHRLDVGLNFHRISRRGHEKTWNLSVYNVYNQKNPITAYQSYDSQTKRIYYTAQSIVPIIPTLSYTWKF